MTPTRFAAGAVLAIVAMGPLVVGADRLRRATLRGWTGLEAALADAVVVLSAVVVVTEALGAVGWLHPVPLTLALAAAGVAAWLVATWCQRARPGRGAAGHDLPPGRLPSWAVGVSVGGIALVVGSWLARTVEALQHGMTTVDTLWYHLPIAVRWLQTGRTTGVQYFDTDPVTAFYPASSSLFHVVGFLLFRTDLASTVVNLGWLALALAGAWAAGRAFGVGAATALAVALLLGTAGMVGTQPGGAYDDVVGLALLLVAVAFSLYRRDEPRRTAHVALIGLVLGLCVGTKYTLVGPAVLLALGLVITSHRGNRRKATIVLLVSAAFTGAYWYVRNAVVVGNPLPSLAVHLGPFSLPTARGATPTSTVAHFLLDATAWRQNLLPGLRSSLGPAWPALVGLAFVGMLAAVLDRREPVVRMLGVVAILSFLAYLVTPQYLVAVGRPFFFGVNVRYASPGLVLGLVLLPIALRRWSTWVVGVLAAVLLVTELDPTAWPTGLPWATFEARVGWGDALWAVALLALAFGLGALAVWGWRVAARQPTSARRQAARWGILAVLSLLALVTLGAVRGEYLHNRYAGGASLYPPVTRWVATQHRQRVVMAGFLSQIQYPLAGADLSNFVQVAGIPTADGGVREPRSCAEWVRMLEQGHYDDVVILPSPQHYAAWTATQPDARLVVRGALGRSSLFTDSASRDYFVYHLDRSRRGRSC